ncbi:MAG: tetratricopeptide repeat protein [Cyanobacteria bacterium J06560_5]
MSKDVDEDKQLPENELMRIDAGGRARVNAIGKLTAENVSFGDRIEGQRRVLEYSIDPIAPNRDVETWVDRTQIQAELLERLKTEAIRLVELVAAGGFGKSLLAVWATEQVSSEFEKSLWINFSEAPSFNAFGRWVNQEIGFLVEEAITDEALINQTIYRLNQRRYLVVMDQLEAIADEAARLTFEAFLAQWQQRGKKSTLLITTRQQFLQADGREYACLTVPGFNEDEGAQFLTQKGVTAAQAKTLSQLSELAQGHPLSLNLAAGWLQETSDSKLNKQGLGFFQRLFQQNIDNLEAQVKEIFNELLERLSPLRRILLLEVVVYRQPFDLAQAKAMQADAIGQDLQQLEAKGFLLLQGERWTLHPLVRQFVTDAAKEDEKAAHAHQKAVDFFSDQLTDDDSPLENYLEGFHHLCELGDCESAYDVIQQRNEWMFLQGHYRILVAVYERLVAEWKTDSTESESQHKFGDLLRKLGNAYDSLGQYERAIDLQQQSLITKREIGDRNGEADSLCNLGNAYKSLGQYERAIDFHQQSLIIKREIGDRKGEAASLGNLGNAYYSLSDYERAIDFLQQALTIDREIGDRNGEALALLNRAHAYAKLDDHWAAREGYEQAKVIFTELKLDHRVKRCEKAIQERNRIIALQPKKAPTIGPAPKTDPNDWREKSMPMTKLKATHNTADTRSDTRSKNAFGKWLPYIAIFATIIGLILLIQ